MSKTESSIRCKIILENICILYIHICNANILKPKFEKQKAVKDRNKKKQGKGMINTTNVRNKNMMAVV